MDRSVAVFFTLEEFDLAHASPLGPTAQIRALGGCPAPVCWSRTYLAGADFDPSMRDATSAERLLARFIALSIRPISSSRTAI